MAEATSGVAVTGMEIGGILFPPAVRPPGSSKSMFLGGAGVRGMEVAGKFIAFTAIGVYLEEDGAVSSLAGNWKGMSPEDLAASPDFFRDIFAGPFEKFTRVTMILPLTGKQYSEKVTENCVAYWKAIGCYTEAEEDAVDKFREAFKAETFPHGSSILFTHSPSGSLTIAFSKDGSLPEAGNVVIESKALSQAVLESIIGEKGVSPAAKESLAERMSELLLKESDGGEEQMTIPTEVITLSVSV